MENRFNFVLKNSNWKFFEEFVPYSPGLPYIFLSYCLCRVKACCCRPIAILTLENLPRADAEPKACLHQSISQSANKLLDLLVCKICSCTTFTCYILMIVVKVVKSLKFDRHYLIENLLKALLRLAMHH
jgi:hypothetical protein